MNQLKLWTFFCLSILFCLPSYGQDEVVLKGKTLFGGITARHIGPAGMSGRVIDLEAHPTDSRKYYVGSAGGGLWVSNDGGVSHLPLFDKHVQSIGAIKLDPNDPDNVIYVGTGEIWTRNSVSVGNGIYKSTDGGANWKHIGLENSERISSILVNPKNSNEVWAGVLGSLWGDSEDRGVYKSMDGGATWEKVFYIGPGTGCSDLQWHPDNPEIMYATFWDFRRTAWSFESGGKNSALYKSMDGGKTWQKIHNGFPSGDLGRIAFAIAPSDQNRLYAAIEAKEKKDKGLYRSEDGGKSWKQMNNDFEIVARPFYFSRLVVSPHNKDFVCKAGVMGAYSKNGGKTFNKIGDKGVHLDMHDYIFDPNNDQRVILGCDGGVYQSLNQCESWIIAKDLPLSQFYHVALDNEKPFNVYGGLQDNGSWYGPSAKDGGIQMSDWKSVGGGDGFRVYPHPTNSDIVYSEMQGADNIWRINKKTRQSQIVKPYPVEGQDKLRFNWNAAISTSLHNPDRLYVGSQFLHISDDMGDSWRLASPDLTTNDPAKMDQKNSGGLSLDNSGAENHCTIFTIAESPLDKQTIWVGSDDGVVSKTTNGGKNWTRIKHTFPGLPKNTWVYHIEPSSHDKNTVYVVFDGHASNDMNAYVYKTMDGGDTWQSITSTDIEGFARSIQEDYVNPDLLYLGTEFGLYVTIDGGKSWSLFENNMPRVAVHHVELHKRDNSLVMATHGRGIIIIDDVNNLRAINKDLLQKDVAFLPSKPSVISERGAWATANSYNEGFVGGNPSTSTPITYYLKKRHTFGKMRMSIYDMDGNQVAKLNPSKSKGINTVYWNHRYPMAKTAKAKTFAYGGFSSISYPAGTYKVVLTKGKEMYETTIELVDDPNSSYTPAQRKTRLSTFKDLYKMNEDLAYGVHKLNAVVDHINMVERSGKLSGSKLKKMLGLKDELQKLHKSLVITTGDNYVSSAEPELREKISGLFGDVSNTWAPPTKAQIARKVLLSGMLDKKLSKLNGLLKKAEAMNTVLKAAGLKGFEWKDAATFLKKF